MNKRTEANVLSQFSRSENLPERAEGALGACAVEKSRAGTGGRLSNLSLVDDWRGYERMPAALLPPSATVTLEPAGEGRVRGRWSAVEGARYRVDLLRDGRRDGYRSLTGSTRTSFRWSVQRAGAYTIRACSMNEDDECGAWSPVSDRVVVD